MKETFYFRHDYNARNDERILELRAEHGYEGYGIYWAIIESMAESSDGSLNGGAIAGLAVGLGVDRAKLEAVIETCIRAGLLAKEENRLFSRRIIAHKQERELYASSGKKGARARWAKVAAEREKDSPPTGEADGPPNSKERKEEERKEEKNREDGPPAATPAQVVDPMEAELRKLIAWLNETDLLKCQKTYTDAALKKYRARRSKWSARQIAEAFDNLRREPDGWKIKNNGYQPLSWWLEKDDRIEAMLNCHLKGSGKANPIPQL